MPLAKDLRRLLDGTDDSPVQIAAGAGVDYAMLVRFMEADFDIPLSVVQALTDYVGVRFSAVNVAWMRRFGRKGKAALTVAEPAASGLQILRFPGPDS